MSAGNPGANCLFDGALTAAVIVTFPFWGTYYGAKYLYRKARGQKNTTWASVVGN